MFSLSRLARAPLRRCLHTKAAAPSNVMGKRAALAIGASAVTASYITWQLTESNRTHCDAPQASSSKLKPNPTSTPPPTLAATSATEVDVFIPDAPSDPVVVAETTVTSTTPSSDATEASSEPPAEGESSGGGANMGAYNPETGEINWDCPCLGGMAHGPCGPEFKEAFSCFIYSEEEPKGINCVEKFQNMQNCFRAHPEVYADEIMRDEEDDEPAPAQAEGADAPTSETTSAEPTSTKTDAAVAAAAADS